MPFASSAVWCSECRAQPRLCSCSSQASWRRSRGPAGRATRLPSSGAFMRSPSKSTRAPPMAPAAQLGTYFTDDVVIDLGRGAAAIRGRATVMDMASRLQPRTSAFTLQLTDIGVVLAPDRLSGSVVVTAEFTRRGGGEDAIDARELSLAMTRADG